MVDPQATGDLTLALARASAFELESGLARIAPRLSITMQMLERYFL